MNTHPKHLAQTHLSVSGNQPDPIQVLLNNSRDLIFITEMDGTLVEANETAIITLEYAYSELIGKCFSQLESVPTLHNQTLFNEPSRKFFETQLKRKDGHIVDVEIQASIIYWNERNCILRIVKDLTEKRQLEHLFNVQQEEITSLQTQLQHQQEQNLETLLKVEQATRIKSAFLTNMSHEIRTPMNAIIGFANLLCESGLEKEQIHEYSGVIKSSGENLLRIIDNIIEISRIEAQELEITPSTLTLEPFLQELLEIHRDLVRSMEKDILLHLIQPSETIESLNIDAIRLRQVVSNLLHNAIKFTEEGKVDFGYTLNPERTKISFFVTDTGIGIPDDEINSIFERFWHGDHSLIRKYGGTGLGLTICKELIERMGGIIHVNSTPNVGTTIRFELPLILETARKDRNITFSNATTNQWHHKRILVVEDEEVNYFLIREILTTKGGTLFWARDGKEAIDFIQSDDVDVILMDIKMPGMSGFEATRIIHEQKPHIPIIAQTAYAMEEDKKKCLETGFCDYIPKPISKDLLIGKLEQIIFKK